MMALNPAWAMAGTSAALIWAETLRLGVNNLISMSELRDFIYSIDGIDA